MLIKNGKVYTPNGFKQVDIKIEDGKIAKVAKGIKPQSGEEVVNAQGKMVLPGAIDVHTHFDLDVGFAKANDDFYTGTVAAACGGTTTIVDHPGFGPDGCDLMHQINAYLKQAKGKAVIDYGFHGVVQRVDDGVLADMQKLKDAGVTSAKVYMTYGGKLTDAEIFDVLKRAKALDMLVAVHCENNGLVESLKKDYVNSGKTAPKYHPKSRPIAAEAEAVNRVLTIGRQADDAPLYLVHISGGLSLEYIDFFKRRGYKNFFVESCPQYFYLTDKSYEKKDGLKYVLSPPLRKKRDNLALWQALNLSEIDTLGTDHCPFNYAHDKQRGKDDFTKCPNGMPGVETRYPLMISAALNGKTTFDAVVSACATNPAKLFGLAPQKGSIQKGADADLVLVDADARGRIEHEQLHETCDYTPFEGVKTRGRIAAVFSRGQQIVKQNAFIGKKGRGQFIKRKTYQI